jgi:hypothetical protein
MVALAPGLLSITIGTRNRSDKGLAICRARMSAVLPGL